MPNQAPEPDRRMRAGLLLLLPALLFGAGARGADADRDQPAQIEADRVELDNQRELSVYEGNVRFVQGSTQVSGERITLQTRDGEIRRLLIEGDPARYQETSNAGQPIEARGLRIEYDAEGKLLRIEGQASLNRPGESFSGERIQYRTDSELVTAHRAEDGSGERVRIVIQPSTEPAPTGSP